MTTIRNFKIGARLAAAFAALLLLLCAVAGFGALQTSKINDNVVDMGTNWLSSVEQLGEMRNLMNGAQRATLRHVLETDAETKAKELKILEDILANRLPAVNARYEPTIASPEEKKLYDSIKTLWATYLVQNTKLLGLSNGGEASLAEARQFAVGESAKAFTDVIQLVESDVQLNSKGGAEAMVTAAATYRQALVLDAIAVAFAIAFGTLTAVAITRSIVAPIEQAVVLAETVARGDLTSTVRSEGKDEPARLLDALARMNVSLVTIVTQVREGSESIATGTSQIATGNADLSQRTEEQASNLQQTAASMEQLTATVKNNADTARQAAQLAGSATDVATRGGIVVGQVVGTMETITASSKRIADIIGVIDGIAFQTNILALNAAVEAARAGEQGRGFAVVASEVRSLAQRSAEAAKEIKGLITQSVEKVETGSRQVTEAGRTMDDIVAQVRRVNDLIAEISTATQEQTQGISQVGDAVTQLDQVTQQNAALVEESAAAAESLKQQASRMVDAVSVFKLLATAAPAAKATFAPKSAKPKSALTKASTTPNPVKTAAKPLGNKTASVAVVAAAAADSEDWATF